MAKEFLAAKGFAFEEKNTADEAVQTELIEKTGAMATPVIIIGDEIVIGFDRGKIQRLLGI